MMRRSRRPPASVVIAIGGLIGFIAILAILAPRVDEFTPASGSESVSSLSDLRIRFNQPMNTLTVESRLEIFPNIPGKIYWEGATLIFEPAAPWPTETGVVVMLRGGSQGSNRVPMIGRRTWSFFVGQPSLIYLWPSDGKSDLYQLAVDTGAEPVRLTENEMGILEYDVAVDGALLVYVANHADGGTALHELNLISKDDRILQVCEVNHPCGEPAISPDGAWLAFVKVEYEMAAAGRLLPASSAVWLLPLQGDQGAYAISPVDHPANHPAWSPTGWLVYYDNRLSALALLNPTDGAQSTPFNYIPTSLGIVGTWSPDGTRLVYPDIIFPEDDALEGDSIGDEGPLYFSHLYMVDVTDGRTIDISPGEDLMVEDASPSFSPDGAWVAFTRKFLDPDLWSPGRQIWLLDVETGDLRALTDEPSATFSSLSWSPDSRRLAYMRKDMSDLSKPSEIGWIEVISAEALEVEQGAYLAKWLP